MQLKFKMMKNPATSKINWIGLVIIALSWFIDPDLYKKLSELGIELPAWFVTEAIRWAGFLIIIFRTFMTEKKRQDLPGPDNPTVDVVLDENNRPVGGYQPNKHLQNPSPPPNTL